MMKKIQIIVLLLLSYTINAQEKLISRLSDYNIQGKVKFFILKTKNYEKPNKIIKDPNTIYVQNDPNFISEFHFNSYGFLYESKSQQEDYTWKKYEFTENKENPLPTKITLETLNNNKNSKQYDYTMMLDYQDQAYLITYQYQNGKKHTVRRELDSNGNVIKEHLVPVGKKIFTYRYDEKNNLIEKQKNQEVIVKYIYEFDKDDEISKKTEIHKSGSTFIFSYEKGLLTKIVDEEGDEQIFTYEFDEKGNWTKRTYKINDVLVSEDFREYVYAEN